MSMYEGEEQEEDELGQEEEESGQEEECMAEEDEQEGWGRRLDGQSMEGTDERQGPAYLEVVVGWQFLGTLERISVSME